MSKVTIGKWGKSLAVRLPVDVVRAIGLRDGDGVDVEMANGEVIIRRDEAQDERRRRAEQAAAAIRAERHKYSLGGLSIRDLINEGRR